MQQGWDGPRLLLGPVGAAGTVIVPVLAHPCSDTNTDTAAAQLKHEHRALRALPELLWNSHGAVLGWSHRKAPLEDRKSVV